MNLKDDNQEAGAKLSPFPQSNPTSIGLKRTVTVKSMVTDEFRHRAKSELSEEHTLIRTQLDQLEAQYQQSLKQLEEAARQGHNVACQMDQLHREANGKRQQLAGVEQELSKQLENLDKVQNGAYITTGQLENFAEVNVGDNLYEKIRGAEILIKDGVVTAILG